MDYKNMITWAKINQIRLWEPLEIQTIQPKKIMKYADNLWEIMKRRSGMLQEWWQSMRDYEEKKRNVTGIMTIYERLRREEAECYRNNDNQWEFMKRRSGMLQE